MEIIMQLLIVLFSYIHMVKLRTLIILPKNLLRQRNGQDCWPHGKCTRQNDKDNSKSMYKRDITKTLQQNIRNALFSTGNNIKRDGGLGFHKLHRTHRYHHHRFPVANITENIYDDNNRQHRKHRKRRHRKRHSGSHQTSNINNPVSDDYVGIEMSRNNNYDIQQGDIIRRKKDDIGDQRFFEDEMLRKKLDELEKQVEKHSYLVHNLVTRNRKASKRAFLPNVHPNIPMLFSRYPYLQTNQYSSPVSRYAPKYLPSFNYPFARLPISKDILCPGTSPVTNAKAMFGSQQGCSESDIKILQGRINMLKKSYRLQEALRRQKQLEYAALIKSRMSKPFYNLQGRTSDHVYPAQTLPYIKGEQKLPYEDGNYEKNKDNYGNSKLSTIEMLQNLKAQEQTSAEDNPSVVKLAQFIDLVGGMIGKGNEDGTASHVTPGSDDGTASHVTPGGDDGTASHVTPGGDMAMAGDLINSISAVLGDANDEAGKPTEKVPITTSSSVQMGQKRQKTNQFIFNGQVYTNPDYPGNVKVVYGTPPSDFRAAFQTQLPPTRITTAFKPFFTLPPGHATIQVNLPTFLQQYPWAWQKKQEKMGMLNHVHLPTAAASTVSSQKLISKTPIKISSSSLPTLPSPFENAPTKHMVISNFTPSKTKRGEATSLLLVTVPTVMVDGIDNNRTKSYNKSNVEIKDGKRNVSLTCNETIGQKGESLCHPSEVISIDNYNETNKLDTQLYSGLAPSLGIKYAFRESSVKEPDTRERLIEHSKKNASDIETMSDNFKGDMKPNKLHSDENFIHNISTPKQHTEESKHNEDLSKTEGYAVNRLNPRYPQQSPSKQQSIGKLIISDKNEKVFTKHSDDEKWNVDKMTLRNQNKTRISGTQRASATSKKEGNHFSTYKEKPTKGKRSSTIKYTKDSRKGTQVQLGAPSSSTEGSNVRNPNARKIGTGKRLSDHTYRSNLEYYMNKHHKNHTSRTFGTGDATREMFKELGSYYTGSYYTDEIDEVLNHRVPDAANKGRRLYNYRTLENTEIIPDIRSFTNNIKEDDKIDTILTLSTKTTLKPATTGKIRSSVMYNSEQSGHGTNMSVNHIPTQQMNTTVTTELPQKASPFHFSTSAFSSDVATTQNPVLMFNSDPSVKTALLYLRSPGMFDNTEKSALLSSLSYPMYPIESSVIEQVHPHPAKLIITDNTSLELFNSTTLEKFSSPENATSQPTSTILSTMPFERLHDSISLPPKLLDNPSLSRLPTFPLYSSPYKSSTESPLTQPHITPFQTTSSPKTPSYSSEIRDYLKDAYTIGNGPVSSSVIANISKALLPQINFYRKLLYNSSLPDTSETSSDYFVSPIQINGNNSSKTSNTEINLLDSNIFKQNFNIKQLSNNSIPNSSEISNENFVSPIEINENSSPKTSNTDRNLLGSNIFDQNIYLKSLSNSSVPNTSEMSNENFVRPIQINEDSSPKISNTEKSLLDSNIANHNFYLKSSSNNSIPNTSETSNDYFVSPIQINEGDSPTTSSTERNLLDANIFKQLIKNKTGEKERTNVLDNTNNNNLVSGDSNRTNNLRNSDLPGSRPTLNINKLAELHISFDDTGNIVNDFKVAKSTERPKVTDSSRKPKPQQLSWGNVKLIMPGLPTSKTHQEHTLDKSARPKSATPMPMKHSPSVRITTTKAGPNLMATQLIRPKGRKGTPMPPLIVPSIKLPSADIPIGNVFQQQLTSEFPLGEAMKMDDMYWTDSREEIEDTCKEQKGTDVVINILAFGDSLTRGYYNNGRGHHPYTMKLQYLLNNFDPKRCFIIDNEGKDGEPAFGEMPKRMETVLSKSQIHYNWAIILGGTNDIYNKIMMRNGRHTAKELSNNIISIHELAQSRGIKTVVVTIPEVFCKLDGCQDMKEMREMVNDNLRRYANENKAKTLLCDIAGALARRKIDHKLAGQVFEGGLHLRPRGYETMARLLFESFVERIYAT